MADCQIWKDHTECLLQNLKMILAGMMSQPHGSSKPLTQSRVVAERKWQLGQHTRDHPSAIMSKLMRFMASNRIAWKKSGAYSLKCRRVGYTPGTIGSHPCQTLLELLCCFQAWRLKVTSRARKLSHRMAMGAESQISTYRLACVHLQASLIFRKQEVPAGELYFVPSIPTHVMCRFQLIHTHFVLRKSASTLSGNCSLNHMGCQISTLKSVFRILPQTDRSRTYEAMRALLASRSRSSLRCRSTKWEMGSAASTSRSMQKPWCTLLFKRALRYMVLTLGALCIIQESPWLCQHLAHKFS